MAKGHPFIGKRFGNYRIRAEIACGGLGCVYRAEHVFLPRTAAIKLLHTAHLESQVSRGKFLQEARLLDWLSHPHILPIYEFGTEGDLPYLVMEYAPGGSLRDLLRQRALQPFSLQEAISILSQIGDALYYAHQKGIIHRDLKPENILFRRRDHVLLADFGIAIVQTATTLEQLADASGTPAYMAPEQFRGEVSRRSDQYSFACIAYELITGHKPFTAPGTLSMALKHLQERPVPPTQLNANLPPQIDAIILKGLEKRRVNRYPDIQTFIEALRMLSSLSRDQSINAQASLSALREKTKEQYLDDGTRLYQSGRYAEALAAYTQALLLDSSYAEAYLGQGNALYYLERPKEALEAFEQAIHFEPRVAIFYNNKGSVLSSLRRYREALAAYKQALRLDPSLAEAQRGKDCVLRKLGKIR